jgi:phosphoglycerate kinase
VSGFDKQTIADVAVAGKRAVVRVDFNVPLKDGKVVDDRRIREALPTIRHLLGGGAAVILMSHLGRPDGKVSAKYSLCPIATRLAQLLGEPVLMAPDCVGPEVSAVASALPARDCLLPASFQHSPTDRARWSGRVMLLENLRFHAEEEANDAAFARQLAFLGDLYVNDAFGAAHRAHASTVGVASFLPAYAGFLMRKEITALGGALQAPERPFAAIIGGAKVSSKIAVLRNLLQKVDYLVVGGGMANTFLKARGLAIGKSLVEDDKLDLACQIEAEAQGKLLLPSDVVVAPAAQAGVETRIVGVDLVPPNWMILDVGPATVRSVLSTIRSCRTVVWNGPVGYYELPEFAGGTRTLAEGLAAMAARTIIGGGDLVAALETAGLAERMSFVSTGGGASLELLEGRVLPGVAALLNK